MLAHVRRSASALVTGLVLLSSGCIDATKTAEECAKQVSSVTCPVNSMPKLRADAAGKCDAMGRYMPDTKAGEVGGTCTSAGACDFACITTGLMCPCGVARYTTQEVECRECASSCGNGSCDNGENPTTCMPDCSATPPKTGATAGSGSRAEPIQGSAAGSRGEEHDESDAGATPPVAGRAAPASMPPPSSTPSGDEAGNSQAAARDLGVLSDWMVTRAFVGSKDPKDYFRFEIREAAELSYSLQNVSGSVTAGLFENQPLFDDTKPFNSIAARDGMDVGTIALEAGVYFVVVKHVSVDSLYDLALHATAYTLPETKPEPGGDASTASDAGMISTQPLEFGGYVGVTDAEDYYRLHFASNGTLSVALQNVKGRAFVQLFEDATTIDETHYVWQLDSGSSQTVRDQTIAAGIYYLRVVPYSTTSALYTLGVHVK